MPTFRYETVGGAGGAARTIEAPDRASAVRALVGRGETPTRVEETRAPGAAGSAGDPAASSGGGGFRRRAMSRAELASFMRELATAVGAGLPVVPALRTIRGAGRAEGQRELLGRAIDSVEHGSSLSDALEGLGKPFDELVVSLVNAGESAGRLPEVLDQAATLLDREQKLKRALIGAMVYPLIILLLVVGAVIAVVTVIVPRVLASVEGQLAALPAPTRIVQGAASFFGSWWWLVLLGLAAAVFVARRVYAQPGPRLAVDSFVLRVPVLGRLVRDVAVARFTRTLGTLVGAGLPVLGSLRITKATLGNRALQAAMDEVSDEVAHGRTIAEPLEATGHFPPLLVQIVAMGEKTGRLDEMLSQAATAFEERTEQAIKLFTAVLPPILICGLAVLVGFVLLAILLPLLELQESIGA